MFCHQCGCQNAAEDRYCRQCGVRISGGSHRRLTLSKDDRKIAGVCGGFARYFGIDSTIVRLAWVMLALLAGWGVIGYVIAWLIMPSDKKAEATVDAARRQASPAPQ